MTLKGKQSWDACYQVEFGRTCKVRGCTSIVLLARGDSVLAARPQTRTEKEVLRQGPGRPAQHHVRPGAHTLLVLSVHVQLKRHNIVRTMFCTPPGRNSELHGLLGRMVPPVSQ